MATMSFSPLRHSSSAAVSRRGVTRRSRHHSGVARIILGMLATGTIAAAAENPAPSVSLKSPTDVRQRATPAASSGLKWDELSKSYDAKPGEKAALFEFRVTNASASAISIESIQTSCGCTVAELPPLPAAPYVLAPGATTTIRVSLDLHGKTGSLSKTVTVATSAGMAVLAVNANIAPLPIPTGTDASLGADRAKNIEIATHDRQAIFKGECAKCHATPAAGKMGQDLYRAVCTICHEASPRASMIPDLNVPRGPRDHTFWTKWITEGGPGTMMPAFASTHDGPLTDDQVGSLALYLFATFSRTPSPVPAPGPSSQNTSQAPKSQ